MINTTPLDGISPTVIKQYSYCPVILWIQTWLCTVEPVSDSMKIGAETVKPLAGKGQIYVRSGAGSAVIDELVNDGKSKTIIERKAFKSHNYSRYVEQVVTSYLVARKVIPGIRRAVIEVEESSKVIDLNQDLVEDVEKIIEKAREIITKETKPPNPTSKRKCTSCWYKKYCPYT